MNRDLETLDSGDMAPTEPMTKAYAKSCADLATTVQNWRAINTEDLAAFNAVLITNNLKPIAAASTRLGVPACTAPGR